MKYPYIENAKIESASIELYNGFAITGWLTLTFRSGGQGFGGYVLGGMGDAKCADHQDQPNLLAIWVAGLFRTADVESMKDLTGKVIRVGKDSEFGTIKAIGHPLKDIWFEPEVELNQGKLK